MIFKNKTLAKFVCVILFLFSSHVFAFSSQDINSFVGDAAITTQIRGQILTDQSLSNIKIDVGTVEGVVTLTGVVNSDADAVTLIQIAQSIKGVKEVNIDHLKIKESKHKISDTLITAEVKGLFLREKLFGENMPVMSINIETNDGVVYLTGTANSENQKAKAVALAKSVKGVKRVESRIEVNRQSSLLSPRKIEENHQLSLLSPQKVEEKEDHQSSSSSPQKQESYWRSPLRSQG